MFFLFSGGQTHKHSTWEMLNPFWFDAICYDTWVCSWCWKMNGIVWIKHIQVLFKWLASGITMQVFDENRTASPWCKQFSELLMLNMFQLINTKMLFLALFFIIFIMCGLLESNKLVYIHFSVRLKEKYTKIFFSFHVLFSKYSLRMRWIRVYICVN